MLKSCSEAVAAAVEAAVEAAAVVEAAVVVEVESVEAEIAAITRPCKLPCKGCWMHPLILGTA